MSKGHILVVEDNLDNYELVHTILKFAGYDVLIVEGKAEKPWEKGFNHGKADLTIRRGPGGVNPKVDAR